MLRIGTGDKKNITIIDNKFVIKLRENENNCRTNDSPVSPVCVRVKCAFRNNNRFAVPDKSAPNNRIGAARVYQQTNFSRKNNIVFHFHRPAINPN
jgi:hypothetical protein